ncbi:MAG: acetylornithine transaminase [Actinobacteria bacterium]|nr:acetylornithine transaminase [Actinomycetota bacterium]
MNNKFNRYLLSNYSSPNIQIVQGEGLYLKDSNGNIYLDFLSGIAVNALGHSHPSIIEAVSKQIKILDHVSNLYSNNVIEQLSEKISSISGINGKIFFCNSGAESIEAALKLSRLTGRKKIVSLENSFHGRTMGALSITGQESKQKPFKPLIKNIKFIDSQKISRISRSVSRKTAAFFIETIQGEGGVINLSKEFIYQARYVTQKKNSLLVIDEIQTGFGRTGNWFHHQKFDIKPDVICVAKALGGGLPMGAMIVSEKYSDLFTPGQHGSTFGGNPVVAKAALAVIETIEKENLLENAKNMGILFGELMIKNENVKTITGDGLLIGVKLKQLIAKEVEQECQKLGLLINAVKEDTLRIAPPLIVDSQQISRSVEIIEDAIDITLKNHGDKYEIS